MSPSLLRVVAMLYGVAFIAPTFAASASDKPITTVALTTVVPHKVCGKNEVYGDPRVSCEYSPIYNFTLKCVYVASCVCASGYVRMDDGACQLNPCGPLESLQSVSKNCDTTCAYQYNRRSFRCFSAKPQCVCVDGTVRFNGKCDFPHNVCPRYSNCTSNESLQNFKYECEPSCWDMTPAILRPNETCYAPIKQCICDDGWLRYGDACQPYDICIPPTHCGLNETLQHVKKSCEPTCERTALELGTLKAACFNPNLQCVCKKGMARNDGACRRVDECLMDGILSGNWTRPK